MSCFVCQTRLSESKQAANPRYISLCQQQLYKGGVLRGQPRWLLFKPWPVVPRSVTTDENLQVYFWGCSLLSTYYTERWQQKFYCIPVKTQWTEVTWTCKKTACSHRGYCLYTTTLSSWRASFTSKVVATTSRCVWMLDTRTRAPSPWILWSLYRR